MPWQIERDLLGHPLYSEAFLGWRVGAVLHRGLSLLSFYKLCGLFSEATQDRHEDVSICPIVAHSPAVDELSVVRAVDRRDDPGHSLALNTYMLEMVSLVGPQLVQPLRYDWSLYRWSGGGPLSRNQHTLWSFHWRKCPILPLCHTGEGCLQQHGTHGASEWNTREVLGAGDHVVVHAWD